MDKPEHDSPDRGTQLAEKRTDFALQRTIIAADRTLMAWIRTSISMIGFGFTIYKFFEYLRQGERLAGRPNAPRNLGLALIGLGTLALLGAIWQNRQFLKRVGVTDRAQMWSTTALVAILMALIGVLAFAGVLAGSGPF